jgi:hypothetical protein
MGKTNTLAMRDSLAPDERTVSGRPAAGSGWRTHSSCRPRAVDERVRRIFVETFYRYLGESPRLSLRSAYLRMLCQYFVAFVPDGASRKMQLKDPEQVPTFNQFRYWCRRHAPVRRPHTLSKKP